MSRASLRIFALALATRVAFALFAPWQPRADGLFYHLHASWLLAGRGYTNPDGSPALQWMPGWPALLALIYAPFGPDARLGVAANVVLGAAAAPLTLALGRALCSEGVGRLAGVLIALWPGLVFYSATLHTEPLFLVLLAAMLLLLVRTAERGSRPVDAVLVGITLGAMAWVKSEPLALGPVLLGYLWLRRPSAWRFVRAAVLVTGTAVLVVLPWSLRNHRLSGEWIATSSSGALVAYMGNHPGATGTHMIDAARRYKARHAGRTQFETEVAVYRAGPRDALDFARGHPGEAFRLLGRKLYHTYRTDDAGLRIVRGPEPGGRLRMPARAFATLRVAADLYWFAIAALAAWGALRYRGWRPGARPLLLGMIASFGVLHLLFIGGARFHVPETPAYALFAAAALQGGRRARALAQSVVMRASWARARSAAGVSPSSGKSA